MAIIASLRDKKLKQLCKNDTKIMFSDGCWAWIWSLLRSLSLDLVPAHCCEPGADPGADPALNLTSAKSENVH